MVNFAELGSASAAPRQARTLQIIESLAAEGWCNGVSPP